MKAATLTLHLRPLDGDTLDTQALKLLLKRLLRSYRLRCTQIDVQELPRIGDPPGVVRQP